MLLEVFSILIAVALVGIILTQVVVPAVKGQSFFPFFRRNWRKVNEEKTKARDELLEAEMKLDAEEDKLRRSIIEPTETSDQPASKPESEPDGDAKKAN